MARIKEPVFKRDGSPYWYAWVPDYRTGETVAKSTKAHTQSEAAAWRRRYLTQGSTNQTVSSVTVKDVLNAYLKSRAEKKLSPETLAFYEKQASKVSEGLGEDTLIAKLRAETIDDYISLRRQCVTRSDTTVVDHTISKELAVLKAALKLAKRRGKWRGDLDELFPGEGDFSPGYDPKKAAARALSRLDVVKLSFTMPSRKFAILAFAIATSAELAALANARRSDVASDRSSVRVRGTKNEHRDRVVPIETLEQAYLLDFALQHAPGAGDTLFPYLSNVRNDCIRAAKAAEVHHFSPHNMRHTLASWLMAGGVHSAIVGRILGHADGRMVERTYGHLRRVEDVRNAVRGQYRPADNQNQQVLGFCEVSGTKDETDKTDETVLTFKKPAKNSQVLVPRDGIEPPTRGFSVPVENLPSTRNRSGSDRVSDELLGFCQVSDPDEALKTAIKAALDKGLLDRAARLLEVLKSAAPVVGEAEVEPKSGRVVTIREVK